MTGRLRFSGLLFLFLFATCAAGSDIWLIADLNDSYHKTFAAALQAGPMSRGARLSLHPVDEPVPTGPEKPALVITLGEKAAARNASWPGPVLHAFVTEPQFRTLYPDRLPPLRTALFLEQPPERYVALVRKALPNVTRIVLPIGVPDQSNRVSLRHAATVAGLSLQEETVATPQDLDSILSRADPATDAMLFLPDPALRTNAMLKIALIGAYKRQIPLIAYSEGLVMAGALMAVHSTIPLLADELAVLIDEFLEKGRLEPPGFSRKFDISVNYQLAKSLGIHIPSAKNLASSIQEASRDM